MGLSRVDIHQRGTALRLSVVLGLPSVEKVSAAPWERQKAFAVFERHKWIESSETIREEVLVALPGEAYTAVRLELRLVVPEWASYLEQVTTSPLTVAPREASGAVLLVKPDGRRREGYALTWGTGHFLLRSDRGRGALSNGPPAGIIIVWPLKRSQRCSGSHRKSGPTSQWLCGRVSTSRSARRSSP